jgi:hypothetical protein
MGLTDIRNVSNGARAMENKTLSNSVTGLLKNSSRFVCLFPAKSRTFAARIVINSVRKTRSLNTANTKIHLGHHLEPIQSVHILTIQFNFNLSSYHEVSSTTNPASPLVLQVHRSEGKVTLYFLGIKSWSWDSLVVQRWAMGCMIGGWSTGKGWEFFSSPPRPDRLWGPPSLLSNGYQGIFSGGKAAEAWSWPLTSI